MNKTYVIAININANGAQDLVLYLREPRTFKNISDLVNVISKNLNHIKQSILDDSYYIISLEDYFKDVNSNHPTSFSNHWVYYVTIEEPMISDKYYYQSED